MDGFFGPFCENARPKITAKKPQIPTKNCKKPQIQKVYQTQLIVCTCLYRFDVSSQLGQASMSCPGLSCTTLVQGIAMTCPPNGRPMKSALEAKIEVLGPTHIDSQKLFDCIL